MGGWSRRKAARADSGGKRCGPRSEVKTVRGSVESVGAIGHAQDAAPGAICAPTKATRHAASELSAGVRAFSIKLLLGERFNGQPAPRGHRIAGVHYGDELARAGRAIGVDRDR